MSRDPGRDHAQDLEAAVRDAVREKFGRMARRRRFHFHYPTGRPGLTGLGYGQDLLDGLPEACATGYCGVGNVLALGPIGPGETVLDAGCGTGCDALLAARRVGPAGRVVGIDLVPEMLELARQGAQLAGTANVRFVLGDLAAMPLAEASVDVALTNGVLNMVPDKDRVLADLFRVLRPGGRLHVADLTLSGCQAAWRTDPPSSFFQ